MLRTIRTQAFAGTAPATGCESKRHDAHATKTKPYIPRKKHRGVSIFGVILGVAVIAVVALGLVSAYQGVVTNTRTQAVLTTLSTMENAVRRNYANLPQFGADLDDGLFGVVPTSAIQGTGSSRQIVTPWGSRIHVGGGETEAQLNDSTGTADNGHFYISVLNLPEAACEAIASAYLNRADVEAIYVKDDTGAFVSADKVNADPVDAAGDIQDDCDGDDDNVNNDQVAIVFRG